MPLVDVTEDEKEYLIKAELPEMKKENVKVTVEDGTLRITGERVWWLQPLAVLSPLYHAVELCRSATTGDPSGAGFVHVTVLVACVAAGVWWGTRTFTRRLAA